MTKKRNILSNNQLILLASAVVIIAVATLLVWGKPNKNVSVQVGNSPTTQVPAIQNSSDLDKASNELDKTDLNSFDTQLNQLGTDASF